MANAAAPAQATQSGEAGVAPVAIACTQVFFDGACPLCRREVALYQRIQGEAALAWVDVARAGFEPHDGPQQEELLRRFHTRRPDGVWLSGAEAFVFVWRLLPGWRWLARLGDLPGGLWLMERGYRGFLLLRPQMQRMARRLER